MSAPDPVDVRLAELRDATAAVRPSANFTDRVMVAAQAIAPARAALTCGWRYAVPAAAVVAIVAGLLAWRGPRRADHASAARDLAAALADPAVGEPW